MKLGTDRNPKFIRLMELLNTSRPMTVGILELLWHATGEFAPQGDIGRFDNRGLAKLVGWKGKPDELVLALVEAGWLDVCAERRLIVHHWEDHSPDFVRKRLERADLPFLRPITPTADNGGQRQTTADNGGQRLPTMPLPCHAVTVPCHALPSRRRGLGKMPDQPSANPKVYLDLDGDKGWHNIRGWQNISEEQRVLWAKAYPAVDLDVQLARAAAWCLANGARGRKKNWTAFLARWFTKAQDQAERPTKTQAATSQLEHDRACTAAMRRQEEEEVQRGPEQS